MCRTGGYSRTLWSKPTMLVHFAYTHTHQAVSNMLNAQFLIQSIPSSIGKTPPVRCDLGGGPPVTKMASYWVFLGCNSSTGFLFLLLTTRGVTVGDFYPMITKSKNISVSLLFDHKYTQDSGEKLKQIYYKIFGQKSLFYYKLSK